MAKKNNYENLPNKIKYFFYDPSTLISTKPKDKPNKTIPVQTLAIEKISLAIRLRINFLILEISS